MLDIDLAPRGHYAATIGRSTQLNRLPSTVHESRTLCRELARAWQSLQALELDEALHIAFRVELSCGGLPSARSAPIEAGIAVLRAGAFALSGNYQAALSLAWKGLRGPLGKAPRRLALTICRYGRWQSGSPERLGAVPPAIGADTDRVDGLCALDLCIDAAAAMRQLKFLPAKWMASDALQFATDAGPQGFIAASLASSLLAQLAYEEGDLSGADHILRQMMRNGEPKMPLDALMIVYPLMARLDAHRSGCMSAVRYLLEGERVGEERSYPRLTAVCLRKQVERYGTRGELECARLSLKRLARLACRQAVAHSGQEPEIAAEYALGQAQLNLLESASADAVEVIRRLHREAIDRNDLYAAAQLGTRLVDALEAIGHSQEASALLLELLRTGMNTGIFQSIMDKGAGVRRLLENMSPGGIGIGAVSPLVRTIVRRWALNDGKAIPEATRETSVAALLTVREQAVLRSIGQGLSNKGIARELGIAPETVKSHAKHIFVKLGTQTRAQAVTRAVQLGLI